MSISSISTTGTSSDYQLQRRQPPPPPTMTATAKLLGTSTDDLQTQLKNGSTLDDIASQKGVSQDDLINAVKSDLKDNKPANAPDLSDDQLTAFATKVASSSGPQGPGGVGGVGGPGGVGGAGGHHHHHGGGTSSVSSDDSTTDTDSNITSLADALGTDKDSLTKMLSSVQDLSSLLQKSGVTGYGSAGSGVATSSLAVDTYA